MSEQELEATGQPHPTTEQAPEGVEAETQNQVMDKAFSQEDVDRIVRDRLEKERKRFEKKFGDVDVDRYRELMEKEENERIEAQKARGEFEEILKTTVSKKDNQIHELQNQLTQIKVDGNLLNAASGNRAINPNQVVALLKNQIRLGETGEAEIVDSNGNVRYTDNGTAMTADDLVKEFMAENPHFQSAGPSGSGSQSNAGKSAGGSKDASQLDMNNPEDRKIYRELMKNRGIRI